MANRRAQGCSQTRRSADRRLALTKQEASPVLVGTAVQSGPLVRLRHPSPAGSAERSKVPQKPFPALGRRRIRCRREHYQKFRSQCRRFVLWRPRAGFGLASVCCHALSHGCPSLSSAVAGLNVHSARAS